MKWEEIIAEARAAGILAFCSEGIAVLKRRGESETPAESGSKPPGEAGEERRQSGQGESQGTSEQSGA
jgi:hypothetical protein